MQRARIRIAGVFILFSLVSASLLQAQSAGTISGRVTKQDGSGIGGVVVVVSQLSQAALTDSNGSYRLDNVPPGTYTIVFSAGEQTDTASDIQVTPGATTTLNREVDWTLSFADTITVYSASRRTERIVEAPAAVTVVSEEQIAREAPTGQLPKVIESAPGVDFTQSGLYDFNFNTRGFNSSLNRRILTLIDGRDPAIAFLGAQEWAALSYPLDEFASVELVRGPGSSLYGANAFNGVLNMTTKAPRYHQGGKLQLTAGDLGTFRGDLRQAGEIGGDWYYRVVGGYQKGDDFTRSRNITKQANPEYSVFCRTPGQTDCLPGERSDLRLDEVKISFGGLRFDKYFASSTLTLEGGASSLEGPTFLTGIGRVQVTDTERPWARINYNMPHWNALAYYDARKAENQIALSSGAPLFEDSHNLHGELQGNYDIFAGRLRVVGGLAYNQQEVDTANPAGVGTLMLEAKDERQQAAFAQLDYNVTPTLRFVVAGRYDDSTLHDSEFSPKASLVYEFLRNQTIRATYNKAFQVPNYSEFFLAAPAAAPTTALAPLNEAFKQQLGGIDLGFGLIPILARGNEGLVVEHIIGKELGYSGIFSNRMFVTLDYYQNEVEDFVTDLLPGVNPAAYPFYSPPASLPEAARQAILATLRARVPASTLAGLTNVNGRPAIVFSYRNAGKVDTQGIEVAFNYYVTNRWVVDFNYSWFDFEVKEVQLGDKLFPNAPENKANVGLGYRGDKFDVRLKYRWIEEFFWATGVFAGNIPSYEVLNLSFNFHPLEHVTVGANVSNALDNEHYEAFGGDLLERRALGYVSLTW